MYMFSWCFSYLYINLLTFMFYLIYNILFYKRTCLVGVLVSKDNASFICSQTASLGN